MFVLLIMVEMLTSKAALYKISFNKHLNFWSATSSWPYLDFITLDCKINVWMNFALHLKGFFLCLKWCVWMDWCPMEWFFYVLNVVFEWTLPNICDDLNVLKAVLTYVEVIQCKIIYIYPCTVKITMQSYLYQNLWWF